MPNKSSLYISSLFLPPLLLLLFLFAQQSTIAQNLHFSYPQILLPGITTDKAIDITNFNGGYFLTWKEVGRSGGIRLSYLGRHYDTSSTHPPVSVGTEATSFAPVFRTLGSRIYLFWIDPAGKIRYILNNSDTSFDTNTIHTLALHNPATATAGITAATAGQYLILATHASDNRHLLYSVLLPNPDGTLPASDLAPIPNFLSAEYPFVVGRTHSLVRFCWKGYKDQLVYRADFDLEKNKWSPALSLGNATAKYAPALYHVWNGTRLFYIWHGSGKDTRLFYYTGNGEKPTGNGTALPSWFNTNNPVSICTVDNNNFLMAYVSPDGALFLSKFANYNPSTWMQDILMPAKSGYSLQDIVLPGAHDAGMSVLSGTGGSQSGTINECNTLTQVKDIEHQLKAGIRMFDLRVGTYEGKFYTKHCSSDCMADAIGGGYGEKLDTLLDAIRTFLHTSKQEIVLLTFSHFCEKETPVRELAQHIIDRLGADIVYKIEKDALRNIPIRQMAGKVIITFEHFTRPDRLIDSCTIAESSGAFINFRREYAATNDIHQLVSRQLLYFKHTKPAPNDLLRLDWQLTESGDEAAMICNDFQSEKSNPLVDGAMLLTNVIRKHKSIIDLSLAGNKYLPLKVNEWIQQQVISSGNKPNILYVDAAGEWITDYCIYLNQTDLYIKR